MDKETVDALIALGTAVTAVGTLLTALIMALSIRASQRAGAQTLAKAESVLETFKNSQIASRDAAEAAIEQAKSALTSFNIAQTKASQSAHLNRLIQAVIHCNKRYHDLESEIRQLSDEKLTDQKTYEHYMIRYWALKSDQFDYWLAGFIDPDAFTTWFSSVARHFSRGVGHFGSQKFSDGWEHGKNYHRGLNPWFIRFIDCIQIDHPVGVIVDRDYLKLKRIISEMEGSRDSPGKTRDFRQVFQAGMDYDDYLRWNEIHPTELLSERLGAYYDQDN